MAKNSNEVRIFKKNAIHMLFTGSHGDGYCLFVDVDFCNVHEQT